MKNFHPLICEISEYCIIIAVTVLPPIFSPVSFSPLQSVPEHSSSAINFAYIFVFYTVFAAFLYRRAKRSYKSGIQSLQKKDENCAGQKTYIQRSTLTVCLCYCALICSAVFWNYIAYIAKKPANVIFSIPEHFSGKLLFFAATAVLAFYEEMLFRFFLPEKAHSLIRAIEKNKALAPFFSKTLHAAAEMSVLILFALSHRYLGIYAVYNALCAAAILRISLCKGAHIYGICIVHTLYNVTIFTALCFI